MPPTITIETICPLLFIQSFIKPEQLWWPIYFGQYDSFFGGRLLR